MEFAPRNLAAFVCSHVFARERAVLLVSHEDGDWQFLCGDSHGGQEAHLVGVGHLIDNDPSINEVADLPVDWTAERQAIGQPWIRTKL